MHNCITELKQYFTTFIEYVGDVKGIPKSYFFILLYYVINYAMNYSTDKIIQCAKPYQLFFRYCHVFNLKLSDHSKSTNVKKNSNK